MKNSVKGIPVSLLKTGLLVDLNSLYFNVRSRYGKKLRILDYTEYLESLGHTLIYKVAYSIIESKKQESPGFLALLKGNGFETHFGRTSWSIAMALRAADIVPNVDCLILGSSNPALGRILSWAKERGKLTKCVSANIPTFFNQFCECREVPREILTDAVATPTKSVELYSNSDSDGA